MNNSCTKLFCTANSIVNTSTIHLMKMAHSGMWWGESVLYFLGCLLKLPIIVFQKAAAPKNGVELCGKSVGTIRLSLFRIWNLHPKQFKDFSYRCGGEQELYRTPFNYFIFWYISQPWQIFWQLSQMYNTNKIPCYTINHP